MKKILLMFFATGLLAVACKKDAGTTEKAPSNNPVDTGGGGTNPILPQFYIYAKINGQDVVLKAANFIKDDPRNPQFGYLGGFFDFPNKVPSFQFQLKRPTTGFTDGLTMVLDENDRQSFVNYTSATNNVFKSTATPAGDTTGIRITFTKFPSDSGGILEGVFSGTLQLEESEATIIVKGGKFKVPSLN
jgi:hypothetical protein